MSKKYNEIPYFNDLINFHTSKVYNRMRAVFDKQFRKLNIDITPEQSTILLELYRENGQYQKQLADKLIKDKPSITRLVDVLEKKKLLFRSMDSTDRRKYKLYLTKEGFILVERILPLIVNNINTLNTFISAEEEVLYKIILDKMNSYVDTLENSVINKIFTVLFALLILFENTALAQEINLRDTPPLKKYSEILETPKPLLDPSHSLFEEDRDDVKLPESRPIEKFDEKSFNKNEIIKGQKYEKKQLSQYVLEDIDLEKEISKNLKVQLCPVSLEDCLNIALQNNFDIKIGQGNLDQRYWIFKNSKMQFLPDYTYFYSRNHYSGEYLVGWILPEFINETAFQHIHRIEWLPFDGGRKIFEVKAQKNYYKSEKNKLDFTKDEVILKTSTQYYTLLGIKMGLEVLHRSLKENQAQLTLTQELYRGGVGTVFDVYRAQAEVTNAQQSLIQTYNSFRLAQATLANTIGVDVAMPLFPVEKEITEYKLVDDAATVDDMYNTAVTVRPDLVAMRYKIIGMENSRKKFYGDYLPSVNFFFERNIVGATSLAPKSNDTVGMLARWSLGSKLGADTYTNLKAADAEIDVQKLTLVNQQRQIKEDIISAYETSLAARARVEAAAQRVESTGETLRVSFLRYDSGVGIFIDVIQAQTAYTDARIELLRAKIDYNTAQIRLLFNMGVISAHGVLEGYKNIKP